MSRAIDPWPDDDPRWQGGRRQTDVIHAERYVRKLERKAGAARLDQAEAHRKLSEAVDAFGGLDYGDLERLAAAGRRVTRLADQLRAAQKLSAARRVLEERKAELAKVPA